VTADAANADQLLASARRRNDPDDLARALAVHANTLVTRGQLDAARRELDEAAAIHHRRDRAYDEAQCTYLAATLARLTGDLDGAKTRAAHAARLAQPGTPLAVSAATELGEIALAARDGGGAADAFGRALAEGEAAGIGMPARAALLRKCAIARVASGQHGAAARDLAEAHDLFMRSGDTATAIRTRVEEATARLQGGDDAGTARLLREATEAATAAGDHQALADLALLQVTRAVGAGDTAAALAAAHEARAAALAAVAPVRYVGAAVAIAELSEARGDRRGAYEALAVGLATLGDLLGRDAAKALCEPKLLAMRERWGPEAFAAVKADYEARQRAQRDG
jgi:hypothetical protein